MANEKLSRPENAPGEFFVDSTCIDCDTCRWLAPKVFVRKGDMSAVQAQPGETDTKRQALRALLACPTVSIGYRGEKKDIFETQTDFPLPIEDGVYYCGFSSKDSFGAASYLIVREGGNVLVDTPRMQGALSKQLTRLGGVRWIFLTHRDDVADHQEWTDRFGCERVLHQRDVTPATRQVEIQPEGEEPLALAPDLLVIPTPGHTAGHSVLLYKDKFLFSGDHLEYDEDDKALRAYRDYCWFDWKTQIESMRKLLNYDFEWILPGHGRRGQAPRDVMKSWMRECVEWMENPAG